MAFSGILRRVALVRGRENLKSYEMNTLLGTLEIANLFGVPDERQIPESH
jgi:hypothetical protein